MRRGNNNNNRGLCRMRAFRLMEPEVLRKMCGTRGEPCAELPSARCLLLSTAPRGDPEHPEGFPRQGSSCLGPWRGVGMSAALGSSHLKALHGSRC